MTKDDTEIVSALERALAGKVGAERFDLWFGANTQFGLRDDALVVSVPSSFFQDWLRSHFRSQIEAACSEALGRNLPVVFQVNRALAKSSDGETSGPTQAKANSTAAMPDTARPRPRRRFARFDAFVVGPTNRLAYVSAQEAVERLGSVSPLLIYGPTGVGKTHLLEGIWSAAKRAKPAIHTVYLSAEQFTTYFLEALRGSGLPSFRRKYRGVELLIVDDLQFFAGKRATLVELLHTLDALLREGRQLVFAADRSPAELQFLGPELRTRLQGGLVCGIEPPDFDTRLGIVRQMSTRLGIALGDDVQKFVAANFHCHARELAGALKRLQAASLAHQQPISLALAESSLAEMIRHQTRIVRLTDIERAVCRVFGLEPKSLQSSRKGKEVSHPRMLAMWLARKYTRAALSEIGHYFGRRSHSTVISAQKKVNGWMTNSSVLQLPECTCQVQEAIRRVEDNLSQRAG